MWGLRGVSVSIDKLWSWNDYWQTNSRRERRRRALPNAMAALPSNVLGCEKILCASLETKYTVGRVKSLYFDFFFFGSLSHLNGSSLPASTLFLESKLNVPWFSAGCSSCSNAVSIVCYTCWRMKTWTWSKGKMQLSAGQRFRGHHQVGEST